MSDNLYHYKATVVSVYDGDTITVDIDLGFSVKLRMPVRLARINAPEIRGETRVAGQAARDFLQSLLPQQVTLKTYKDGREKYGRYLADVWVGNVCISDAMVAAGFAVWAEY